MTVDDCIGYALQDGLQEKLNQLEQGRISLQRRKLKIVTGLLLLAAVTMAVMVFVWRDPFSGFFMLLLILLGGFFLVISKNNTLLTQFKQTVIPQLLRIAIPGLRYDCEACLSSADFCNTRLFRSPDRYNGKDLFTGSIGKTRLCFSMVHAEERHETTTTDTDSDGHTTTRTEEHWYNIFQGQVNAINTVTAVLTYRRTLVQYLSRSVFYG